MTKTYFAPGRINLIGEHLDYNGGLVMPAALTIGIKATFKKRDDDRIILRSATHDFFKEIKIDEPIAFDSKNNDWANYPMGVIKYLRDAGHRITAGEIIYESTLPESSGLSSSAAIEVVTAYLLLDQAGIKMDGTSLAKFCRVVENEFIKVQCGIMDQFAISMGKADHAILLNCSTLDYQYVPLYLNDYRLLILNSRKPRNLIHSHYNERKEECEKALQSIRASFPVNNLCEADYAYLDLLDNAIIRKRARHVITENLRVKEAVKALRLNDLTTFGRLMNASHESLKNDYQVSGIELDTLVEEAQQVSGCLGARMTGAGFGGCAIALVHKDAIETITTRITQKYSEITGLKCEVYESEIGNGVGEYGNLKMANK
jgi:galactokinase